MVQLITAATLLVLPTALGKSLWVPTTPQNAFPYALKKGDGISLGSDDVDTAVNIFPVTGNSSDKAFCILQTLGPGFGIAAPQLFAHVHRRTYENFYTRKGRVQLWGQNAASFSRNESTQETRILTAGDFGGIPNNTIHTFNLLEPDTLLTGVLVPGGFEEFFFAMGSNPIPGRPTTSSAAPAPTSTGPPTTGGPNLTMLAAFDVFPQFGYQPRLDLGPQLAAGGLEKNWYNGSNALPEGQSTPIWVAKNYGPKYLHTDTSNGVYQIIAPLVTNQQTENRFAQGHVTMSPAPEEAVDCASAPLTTSPGATAFVLEEGQLRVIVDGYEGASLIDGDTVFVPPNTGFRYCAEAEFTKFMYVSGGLNGLDAQLIEGAEAYESAYYPRNGTQAMKFMKRGFRI